MAARDTKERYTMMMKFRYPRSRADLLQLIADAETGGNLSLLLRDLADRKIEERLRRREKVA